jgi:hypothetical protein
MLRYIATIRQWRTPLTSKQASELLPERNADGVQMLSKHMNPRQHRPQNPGVCPDLLTLTLTEIPMAAEHYADDLEAVLEQALGEDFSVQLEDGSAILVAKQLVTIIMHNYVDNIRM